MFVLFPFFFQPRPNSMLALKNDYMKFDTELNRIASTLKVGDIPAAMERIQPHLQA